MLLLAAEGWLITPPLKPQTEDARRAELVERRANVMRKIGPNAMLLLFAAEPHMYTGDAEQQYREENNFYYLTGLQQTGAALALIPGATAYREVLFLPAKDRSRVVFTGSVVDAAEAKATSGIAEVLRVSDMASVLALPLNGPSTTPADAEKLRAAYMPYREAVRKEEALLFLFLPREEKSAEYRQEQALAARVASVGTGITVKNAGLAFRELRLIKSPREIELIQQAIDISGEGFERALAVAAPGRCECDLQAEFDYTYARRRARYGYPTIAGSGVNGTVLHYDENHGTLHDGELVVIDAGAEYDQYSADVTRTIPVNGKFSKEQAQIYRIVYDAQQAAIASARSGTAIGAAQKIESTSFKGHAISVIKDGLLRLGLITSTENDEYRNWLPHGVSHQLGMNVHDLEKPGLEMAPGMIMTIEPGLYFRPDALDALPKTKENAAFIAAVKPAFEKYKGIGVRIEDDILITAGAPKVLSGGIPSKLEDVERAMAAAKMRLKTTPLP